ncbi:DNA-binding protein [Deinococcus roseus]|uniref:DNA-binding protein n=2 Tax=Deinococcus roseus TaxID=392414 RepID=A0ABQ2D903_9DEIO|nr:DNA-binding protein [Deinococcus roseus]
MLETLYVIQQMDLELDRLKSDETRIPGDLASARSEREELNEQQEHCRTRQQETRREIQLNELELEDYRQKLGKSREEQQKNAFDARTQVQYENQIQQLSDRVTDLEEALAPLYERAEKLRAQWNDLEEQEDRLSPRLVELEAMDENRIQALRDEHSEKLAKRNELIKTIDARQVKEYEMIRKARKGLAVVAIQNSRCSGCNMQLPVTIQQQAKARKIPAVKCTSCGRILVHL